MDLPIYVVDAFADQPFTGNPAGVVPLTHEIDESVMRSIAAEMKHAETAFLVPKADAFQLRWFTPEIEVDLCGHATLACAHILYQHGYLRPEEEAKFDTRSGRLTAQLTSEGIRLNFPSLLTDGSAEDVRAFVAEGLGAEPFKVFRSNFDLLAELESEAQIRALTPNFELFKKFNARGVIVTARADATSIDFVSRFFGPEAGVPEDPVTGSAHCCLAPYWSKILGKDKMLGYQASPRGGFVWVELSGDRVYLTGTAITVLAGTFSV